MTSGMLTAGTQQKTTLMSVGVTDKLDTYYTTTRYVFSKRQRITLRLLYAIGRPSVVCLSVCLSSVCRL